MADLTFPKHLDVFLPMLDGIHPVAADTHNELGKAIERIQTALGVGRSSVYASSVSYNGPKGNNATVAARLNKFLDADGGLNDIVFVHGEGRAGEFSESIGGKLIGFGKSMSAGSDNVSDANGYHVVFQMFSDDARDDAGYIKEAPHFWWLAERRIDSCRIAARTGEGVAIDRTSDVQVKWAMLVIGPTAVAGTLVTT